MKAGYGSQLCSSFCHIFRYTCSGGRERTKRTVKGLHELDHELDHKAAELDHKAAAVARGILLFLVRSANRRRGSLALTPQKKVKQPDLQL